MTGVYFDTSALAKWYINEPFSDEVESYLQAHGPVQISTLTLIEMRSLLARRRRDRSIDATIESRAFATLENDVHAGHLIRLNVHDGNLVRATSLIAQYADHPLRTLDALHLAIALERGAETLATADGVMADAAESMGLSVIRFLP